MRRLPSNQPNAKIRRERDSRALSRLALLLFSALVLAGGFVFAAQQHFAAVHYGYQSEALRKEREQLVREEQQLQLEKEKASSPARLESAARALGLKPLSAGQVVKRSNQSGESKKPLTQAAPAAVATTVR